MSPAQEKVVLAYLDAVRVLFPTAYKAMKLLRDEKTFTPKEIRALLIVIPDSSDYVDAGYTRAEQRAFDSARRKLARMRDGA